MREFSPGWLPTVGFIVPDVACAWLYVTDSDVAFMENVLSNPGASDEDRGAALDMITKEIFAAARQCGSKWLVGASNIESVISRAVNGHGFIRAERPVHQLIKVL